MQNDIYNELSTNFIEYAAAVNTDRAIPDAKSGLKPVARRILWSTFEEGRLSNKPHVKSARIVGDVMGRYHPHGDSSIYGAMVRLSQPWVMRYPLIDWHGNNGNIAGDGPAASRYTEARLSKLSEEGLLNGIKKKNVDFSSNYDETLEEPVTLPSAFPNLLCNPNTGIGVAMACNWAPHNLNDVAKAIIDYVDGAIPRLPGPDFPTGGLIINKNDIPRIMETGRGSVKIRARYTVEKDKLIFYEVPYGQTIEGLIAEVGEACEKKEIEGISDIHDESSKKIRIVVTCERGIDPNIIAHKIYSKTNFQTSFSYNQVALVDKTPTELNLKDAIKIYVDHNLDCIRRECKFDIEKVLARLEIVEGLLKALEDIDNIIALIKQSENAAAAKEKLIAKYNFTENQAKAILAMRLSSLAKLEAIELNKEAKELENKRKELEKILSSEDEQINVLKDRLSELVKKYGDERRTEIIQLAETKEEIEKIEIVPEDVVVIINVGGNIKRIPKKNFKVQHKNGVGVKNAESAILTTISTNTIDTLMVFTSSGKMYRLNVDKIPEGTNTSKGINIRDLLSLSSNEDIQTVCSFKKEAKYVVFFSLIEDDKEDILLFTKKGICIRFSSKDNRAIGRLTCGSKAIKLKKDDLIVSAIILKKIDKIIITTKNGKGKRISSRDFTVQMPGGAGVSAIKLDKDDEIAGAVSADTNQYLFITGTPNSICIPIEEIPIQTKTSMGVKLIEKSIIKNIVTL